MSIVNKDTTFLGYRRENGRVGVRNHVVILPLDDLSNAAAEAVAHNIKGAMAIPHPYGRLQFGADLELHFRERHASATRRGGNRIAHWLRFLPAPSFSLFLTLIIWWAVVVKLAPPTIERAGIWVGVVGFFVPPAMAYHAQRHRL